MVVECWVRKPCWEDARGRVLSSGRRSRSRTLTEGHRREMGRYPDPELAGLPGFRIGMIVECFQIDGILAVLYDRLKM